MPKSKTTIEVTFTEAEIKEAIKQFAEAEADAFEDTVVAPEDVQLHLDGDSVTASIRIETESEE